MMRHQLLGATLAASILLGGTLAPTHAQQNPDGVIPLSGMSNPFLLLLHDPQVHSELQLNAAQREKLTALCDELDGEFWTIRNKSPQASEAILERLKKQAQPRLTTILSDAQRRRLREIEWRTIGWPVLVRPEVAPRLSIDADTQKKIQSVLDHTKSSVGQLEKELKTGKPRQELEQRLSQLRQDEQKDVLAALSRDQQGLLQKAIGEPLDLSRLGRIRLKAPEFPSDKPAADWLNSKPLTLGQLQGRVTVLFYWTYG